MSMTQVVAPLLSMTLILGRVEAQTVLTLDLSRECDSCRLDLEAIAVLEGSDPPGGGGIVGEPRTFITDSHGRFLTVSYVLGSEIQVFSPIGDFQASVGQEGSGPGEFQHIGLLRPGPGDSIWAFELLGRVTILTPDLEYGRSFQFNHQLHDAVLLPTGFWVVNADVATLNRIGLPLHLISLGGELGISFGAETPTRNPFLPYTMMRSVTASGESCVWSASRTQYVIEEWCQDGTLRRKLVRKAAWFRPYLERGPIGRESPPPPWIMDIHQDREGRLWVLISVPSDDWGIQWKDGVKPGPECFDTIVEVIDPVDGKLIRSQRIPQPTLGFYQDGRVFAYEEDVGGQPSISVFAITLRVPGPTTKEQS
jgi:hypothetical protein